MLSLSICVPTFNRSQYLVRCLESILVCRDPNIEVVVQDNCSPDNTRQAVESFSDARIKYFRNDSNIGVARNIIKILENATGEYVYYLTDDDFLLPGALKLVGAFIALHRPAFFTSDLIVYLEKQKKATIHASYSQNVICGKTDYDKIARIFFSSHILSRVCFLRTGLDLDYLRKNGDNWYPEMLIGLMLHTKGPLAYLAEPTALHTWENETFWGISTSDAERLNQGITNIIKCESHGMDYLLLERIVSQFALEHHYFAPELAGMLTAADLAKLKRALLRHKIESCVLSGARDIYESVLSRRRVV